MTKHTGITYVDVNYIKRAAILAAENEAHHNPKAFKRVAVLVQHPAYPRPVMRGEGDKAKPVLFKTGKDDEHGKPLMGLVQFWRGVDPGIMRCHYNGEALRAIRARHGVGRPVLSDLRM